MNNFVRNSVAAALLVVAGSAWCQTPAVPESLSVDTLFNLIRQQSPRLELERQSIALATAEVDVASAYPNPTLSAHRYRQPGALTNFSSQDARDVSLDIPLLVGGQRDARRNAALKGLDLSKARYWLNANDLAAEAGARWVALLVAQEKLALTQTALDDLQRVYKVVQGRKESGLASAYDVLRVDVEVAGFKTRLSEAQLEVLNQQSQLATLLGLPAWRPVAQGSLQPNPAWMTLEAVAPPPLLTSAQLDEQVAQSNVEVARRERTPAFSLNAARFSTTDPSGYTNTLGVSVEIPLMDTRKAQLDRAMAQAQSAQLRRQLAQSEVEATRRLFQSQVQQRSDALKVYQQEVGDRLQSLKQMSVDAYQLGRTSILELLDATRTRVDVSGDLLVRTGALMESQIRLQGLGGKLLGMDTASNYLPQP